MDGNLMKIEHEIIGIVFYSFESKLMMGAKYVNSHLYLNEHE